VYVWGVGGRECISKVIIQCGFTACLGVSSNRVQTDDDIMPSSSSSLNQSHQLVYVTLTLLVAVRTVRLRPYCVLHSLIAHLHSAPVAPVIT